MAPEEEHTDTDITLVRGADGALYVINEKEAPLRLAKDKQDAVNEVLKKAEADLTSIIQNEPWYTALSCTHHVRVKVPDVFT